MVIEDQLKKLGLNLPNPPPPEGNYVGAKLSGVMAFTSGQTPFTTTKRGLVGKDLTIDEGYSAARETCLNCLAQLKCLLGSLDRIKQVIQVVGYINSAEGFMDQAKVLNGFTDLLTQLFGEVDARPVRAAIPIHHLGLEAIEVWMIVEVK